MRRPAALGLLAALAAGAAFAEEPQAAEPRPRWSLEVSAAGYFVPDDGYLQPTVRADRASLHLEARYNYEDRGSTSFFAGWSFDLGERLTLELTPMLGGVVGHTDGIVPALMLDLAWGPLELYAEGEYVIDLGDHAASFLYNWSELSVWPTGWLRAGLVTQRTRVYQTDRDIQRGMLLGVTGAKLDGTVYWFNPGADDQLWVASLAVRF